jgi:putative ABC transport system substrate-binding protein
MDNAAVTAASRGASRRRRQLMILAGAVLISSRASAQRMAVRRISVLVGTANSQYGEAQLAAFREGLRQLGWIDGQNAQIEVRWGRGDIASMRAHADALAASKADVVAVSSATALREVQRAIRGPIVFWGVSDPLGNKFVADLVRPGGNITGFSLYHYEIGGKWLQLLKEIAPRVNRVLVLQNARNPNWPQWLRGLEPVSQALHLELIRPSVSERSQIAPAVSAFARSGAQGGVLVLPDPFLGAYRELVLDAIGANRLPSVFGARTFIETGGLIAYDVDQVDLARQAGAYVGRILMGENPGALPIQAPTKYETVVNLKTAHALGLKVPDSILLVAKRVGSQ